jgi:hypothetical protein
MLWQEWIGNLALRRVYYLEHDHYEERMHELNALMDLKDPEDSFQDERPPWLPHPELRETVPNVSLNSVLYQLPNQFTTTDLDDEASDLDRQLAATVDFFDQCIPNQPGFSSSVAAVSILPDAKHVALAWTKWYRCGKKLRQLRFVKRIVQERVKQQQSEEEVIVYPPEESPEPTKNAQGEHDQDNQMTTDNLESIQEDNDGQQVHGDGGLVSTEGAPPQAGSTNIVDGDNGPPDDVEASPESNAEPQEDEKDSGMVAALFSSVKNVFAQPDSKETETVKGVTTEPADKSGTLESTESGQTAFGSTVNSDVERQGDREPTGVTYSIANAEETGSTHGKSTKEDKLTTPEPAAAQTGSGIAVKGESGIRSDKGKDRAGSAPKFEYRDFDMVEYARTIGLTEEAELENLFADFGIEQLAVYSREFAQRYTM